MKPISKHNIFIEIIQTICKEADLQISLLSQGWIIEIKNDKTKKYIFGYSFPLNQDTPAKICNDKSATFEILNKSGILVIPHHLFHLYAEFTALSGNWSTIMKLFSKYEEKVVIKPNEGTGGSGVYVVTNLAELESVVHKTLKNRQTFCICPYIEIEDEYRVIVLDGTVELIYRKVIAKITGDGKSTVLDLISRLNTDIPLNYIQYLENSGISLHSVLQDKFELKLNWKHNLGQGAKVDLSIKMSLKKKIETIALNAAKVIGIQFASVDIVRDSQGNLMVIEVNSGVMLVNFSLNGDLEYQYAKDIYTKAIYKMLE